MPKLPVLSGQEVRRVLESHKHIFPQVCAVDNVLAAARAAMQGS